MIGFVWLYNVVLLTKKYVGVSADMAYGRPSSCRVSHVQAPTAN